MRGKGMEPGYLSLVTVEQHSELSLQFYKLLFNKEALLLLAQN